MMNSKIVFAMAMAFMMTVEGNKLGFSLTTHEQEQQDDFTASVLNRQKEAIVRGGGLSNTGAESHTTGRRLKKSSSKSKSKSGKGSGPTASPSVSLAPSRQPSGAPSGAPSISAAPSLSAAPTECGKGKGSGCDNIMSSSKKSKRRQL